MLTRVDLTVDCANPQLLAAFWKAGARSVDEPPPPPFGTREEWLAQFDDAFDDGMQAAWLNDPTCVAPRLRLRHVPGPKTAMNRLHLDLRVSGDGTPEQRWSTVMTEVAGSALPVRSRCTSSPVTTLLWLTLRANEFCVA